MVQSESFLEDQRRQMSKIIMIVTDTVEADQYGRIMEELEKALPDCFLFQETTSDPSFAVPDSKNRRRRKKE